MIKWAGAITVLAIALWCARLVLLRSLAKLWVSTDRLERADAIVVLGGGLDIRPAAAAELYKQRTAKHILVPKSQADKGREAGFMREALLRNGVPASAVREFEIKLHSTYGEARGVLEWAKSSGIQGVIIPIDIFQTRRVRWIFKRELSRVGVRISVQAITPSGYSTDDWWRHKAGIANFRSELIKFAYYRVRY